MQLYPLLVFEVNSFKSHVLMFFCRHLMISDVSPQKEYSLEERKNPDAVVNV